MGQTPTVHMLYTCPFCWKVRGVIEHIGLDVNYIGVNGMKIKKSVAFAGDWGKVPVFSDENGQHHVDSTPIMKHIDAIYNDGKLTSSGDAKRQEEWLEWADTKVSKATVPILYGTLGSALKTTTRISKLEKFGFISKRLYAWAGFPIMWGIIAKKRVKNDGRTPKKLWHDLLTEFTDEHGDEGRFCCFWLHSLNFTIPTVLSSRGPRKGNGLVPPNGRHTPVRDCVGTHHAWRAQISAC